MALDNFMLSQTVLKKIESGLCPRRINEQFIVRITEEEDNENFKKGWFFEELCIGSTAKEQDKTELPKKKNGEPYIDEIRIIEQSKRFHKLFNKNSNCYLGYDILESQVKVSHKEESGVIDFTAKRDDDDFIYLFDIKLTSDIDAEMSKYSWTNSNVGNLDLIQAVNYVYLFSCEHEVPIESIRFIYIIFDYSKDLKIKLISCNIKEDDIKVRNIRFSEGWRILTEMESDGFPEIPSFKSCFSCPINNCDSRIQTDIPIEYILVDVNMDEGNKIINFKNYRK